MAERDNQTTPPEARDMTPEERAECERLTRDAHEKIRKAALDDLARITQEELGGYEVTDNPLDRSKTTDCPLCGGDCGGANPLVVYCPMRDSWHEIADRTKCQASSQRGDGECWWRYCPAKDGHCPLPQEEYEDA